MRVRRFTETGIEKFREFLDSLKTDRPEAYPEEILTGSETSGELAVAVHVEKNMFKTRFEAGKYLCVRFAGKRIANIEYDKGLWTWLACFYFDELCPLGKDGQRKPGNRVRHIPDVTNVQRYYRHLLLGPFRIYKANNDDPERALALLAGHIYEFGDVPEQICGSQEMVTNNSVLEITKHLYINPNTKSLKPGHGGKGAGSPRRLVNILNQFDCTFDLYSMSAEDILNLLPKEFDRFKNSS